MREERPPHAQPLIEERTVPRGGEEDSHFGVGRHW